MTVIQLPLKPRSCWNCVHALQGEQTYCPVWQEVIVHEVVAAQDCEAYERDE